MPRDLTPAARGAWRSIVKDLGEAGILAHSDGAIIEAAATMWTRARQASESLDREGLTVVTPQGRVANPLSRIERASWAEFRLLAEHLGLSPSARARLGLRTPDRRTLGTEAANRLPPTTRRHPTTDAHDDDDPS
ncbi:MAG: phage terminase small subunit P27 family [Candidatus Limnocylindrales bacterium]